jgi:hypothetical protein
MIRKSMMIMFALLLTITTGTVVGAEMAKEGSGKGVTYFTSTSQVLAQGKENFVANYDARGVSGSNDDTSPFYRASGQCVGTFRGIKGQFKELGLCTYTRPNGDKIFMSYEAAGKLGAPVKGTSTIVGGTGECDGITGNGEFTRTSIKGPAEGIRASISKSTVSWKIP